MLNAKMQEALNAQINEEHFSSYLYASMANYFESTSLKGFAKWMRNHSDEETLHAKKLVAYVNNRGGRVLLGAIAAPKSEWTSPLEAMTEAYSHECHISECINKLQSLAAELKDNATHSFLEWFVDEQVEEEATVDDVVQQLKLVEGAPGGLFLIDRDLGTSTPAEAAAAE